MHCCLDAQAASCDACSQLATSAYCSSSVSHCKSCAPLAAGLLCAARPPPFVPPPPPHPPPGLGAAADPHCTSSS
eukprot:2649777-Prymnesium_polylepis.1